MEDLVGRWKLESRDNNFDQFMQCRQARWFLRNIINKFSADFEYSLSSDGAVFTKQTITSFRTGVYPMPIDTEFTPEGTLSGRPEVGRITQTSGRKVVQEMRFKDTNEHAATIEHQVKDGKLHIDLKCKDIVCHECKKNMEKLLEQKPKEIVNQLLGQDGILYLEVKWQSTWVPFQLAVQICGNKMIDQFLQAHGLGKDAKPPPSLPATLHKAMISPQNIQEQLVNPPSLKSPVSTSNRLAVSHQDLQTNSSQPIGTKDGQQKTAAPPKLSRVSMLQKSIASSKGNLLPPPLLKHQIATQQKCKIPVQYQTTEPPTPTPTPPKLEHIPRTAPGKLHNFSPQQKGMSGHTQNHMSGHTQNRLSGQIQNLCTKPHFSSKSSTTNNRAKPMHPPYTNQIRSALQLSAQQFQQVQKPLPSSLIENNSIHTQRMSEVINQMNPVRSSLPVSLLPPMQVLQYQFEAARNARFPSQYSQKDRLMWHNYMQASKNLTNYESTIPKNPGKHNFPELKAVIFPNMLPQQQNDVKKINNSPLPSATTGFNVTTRPSSLSTAPLRSPPPVLDKNKLKKEMKPTTLSSVILRASDAPPLTSRSDVQVQKSISSISTMHLANQPNKSNLPVTTHNILNYTSSIIKSPTQTEAVTIKWNVLTKESQKTILDKILSPTSQASTSKTLETLNTHSPVTSDITTPTMSTSSATIPNKLQNFCTSSEVDSDPISSSMTTSINKPMATKEPVICSVAVSLSQSISMTTASIGVAHTIPSVMVSTSTSTTATVNTDSAMICSTVSTVSAQPTQLNNTYCKHCDKRFLHVRSLRFHYLTSCKEKNPPKEDSNKPTVIPKSTKNDDKAISISTKGGSKPKKHINSDKSLSCKNMRQEKHNLQTTPPKVSTFTADVNFTTASSFDSGPILPLTGFDQLDDVFDLQLKDLLPTNYDKAGEKTKVPITSSSTEDHILKNLNNQHIQSDDNTAALKNAENPNTSYENSISLTNCTNNITQGEANLCPLTSQSKIQTDVDDIQKNISYSENSKRKLKEKSEVLKIESSKKKRKKTTKKNKVIASDSTAEYQSTLEMTKHLLQTSSLYDDISSPSSTIPYDMPDTPPAPDCSNEPIQVREEGHIDEQDINCLHNTVNTMDNLIQSDLKIQDFLADETSSCHKLSKPVAATKTKETSVELKVDHESIIDVTRKLLKASEMCDDLVSPAATIAYDLPEGTLYLDHVTPSPSTKQNTSATVDQVRNRINDNSVSEMSTDDSSPVIHENKHKTDKEHEIQMSKNIEKTITEDYSISDDTEKNTTEAARPITVQNSIKYQIQDTTTAPTCLINEEVSAADEKRTSEVISVRNDDEITPKLNICSITKKTRKRKSLSCTSDHDTSDLEVASDFVLSKPKHVHLPLYQKDKIIPNDIISQIELNTKPFKENGESNPIKTKIPRQNNKKCKQNSTSVLTFENDIMQKESSLPLNITSDNSVNLCVQDITDYSNEPDILDELVFNYPVVKNSDQKLLNVIPDQKLVDTAEKLLDTSPAQKQLGKSPNQKLVESDYSQKLIDTIPAQKLLDNGPTQKLVDTDKVDYNTILTNNLENPSETTLKERPKNQILKDCSKLDNTNPADTHFLDVMNKLNKIQGKSIVDTDSLSPSSLQCSDESIQCMDDHPSDEQLNKEINNPFLKLIGNEKSAAQNYLEMSLSYVTTHSKHKNTKENHIDNIVSNGESSLVKQKPSKRVRKERCLSKSQISVADSDEEKPKYAWLYDDNFMMLSSTRRGREFKGFVGRSLSNQKATIHVESEMQTADNKLKFGKTDCIENNKISWKEEVPKEPKEEVSFTTLKTLSGNGIALTGDKTDIENLSNLSNLTASKDTQNINMLPTVNTYNDKEMSIIDNNTSFDVTNATNTPTDELFSSDDEFRSSLWSWSVLDGYDQDVVSDNMNGIETDDRNIGKKRRRIHIPNNTYTPRTRKHDAISMSPNTRSFFLAAYNVKSIKVGVLKPLKELCAIAKERGFHLIGLN